MGLLGSNEMMMGFTGLSCSVQLMGLAPSLWHLGVFCAIPVPVMLANTIGDHITATSAPGA